MNQLGICCVIGGNGFLGSNIASQLYKKGYTVRVLDIHDRLTKNLDSNIQYVKCDITKADNIKPALTGIQTIFLCAAVIDLRPSPSKLLYDVNVNGTRNIINFCNNNKSVQNLVYTSSVEAADIESIHGSYSSTKQIAEQIIIKHEMQNKNLNICVIRIGA
eukprot:346371_1